MVDSGLYPQAEHRIALSGIFYFLILWVWIAAFSLFGETLTFGSVWPFTAFHLFFFVFPRPSRFTVTSLMIIVFRHSREIFPAKKNGRALNYRKTKLATVTEFLPAGWSDVSLQELVETKTREIRRKKHLQSLWGQKHNCEATLGAYFSFKQQRQSHYDGVLYYGEWCLCLSQSGPTIACFCARSREFLDNVAVKKANVVLWLLDVYICNCVR